jgi:uncharacterized protein
MTHASGSGRSSEIQPAAAQNQQFGFLIIAFLRFFDSPSDLRKCRDRRKPVTAGNPRAGRHPYLEWARHARCTNLPYESACIYPVVTSDSWLDGLSKGDAVGKEDRGFASMDREKQREIASKGGKVAHEKGRAHQWSREEARAAGRKGGLAAHQRRQATSLTE